MKKSILTMVLILLLFSCSQKATLQVHTETITENNIDIIDTLTEKESIINGVDESVASTSIEAKVLEIESEVNMQKLRLFVDDVEVDVSWEDNASVNQIKELAKNNPIIINAHQYGGFEQVGEIGQNIISNNVQMTTEAGDIVLYAGSNIVVFYGSNSWSYTKLGKINKTKEELKNMLDKSNVIFKISH